MKRTIKTFGDNVVEGLVLEEGGVSAKLEHITGDPDDVFRIYVERNNTSIEICPSKGLSVRDTTLAGQQMFWDSPLPNLPDPKKIDLAGDMIVGGTRMKGMTWVAYFSAHVEMLGIKNWGIPKVSEDGEFQCLHGNASMIPVEEVTIELSNGGAVVEGSFFIRDANGCWPPSDSTPIFKITKRIELPATKDSLWLSDTIENVSDKVQFPDWGYHVQLLPKPGCKFTIPSESVLPRGENKLPKDYEIWHEAKNPPHREERGFVHKGVKYNAKFPDGSMGFESILSYGDNTGIRCIMPRSPYVMSWFSCGGADDDEFLFPDGSKWLHNNWDGVGPEVGASALDNDEDVDPGVVVQNLNPGESTKLNIVIEPL